MINLIETEKKMFRFLTSNDNERDEETILLSPLSMDLFIEKDLQKQKKLKYGNRKHPHPKRGRGKEKGKKRKRKRKGKEYGNRLSLSSDLDLDEEFNIVPTFLSANQTNYQHPNHHPHLQEKEKRTGTVKGKKLTKKPTTDEQISFEAIDFTGDRTLNSRKKTRSLTERKNKNGKVGKKRSGLSPRKVKNIRYKDNTKANEDRNRNEIRNRIRIRNRNRDKNRNRK